MDHGITPEQINLVQQSFRQVEAIRDTAAKLFYAPLREIDPSTAPLFATSDMPVQGHKLMAALAMAVNGLGNPERVIPAVQDMARRHLRYGVVKSQYASVGAALLWTLGQVLGADYTPEAEAA